MKKDRSMKATEILIDEHRVIKQVLAAFERGINYFEAGKPVRLGLFEDSVAFFKGFTDGCHHVKEEKILFTRMAEHGVPVENGPIGVMLSEHDTGRKFIRLLGEAVRRYQDGDTAAKAVLLENARGYILLLEQHIMKEHHILFPMADRVIPIEDHDLVLEGFESIEHEETGDGIHEKYLHLAQTLEGEVVADQ
jgi:hemerythrin-like domain-containing protein